MAETADGAVGTVVIDDADDAPAPGSPAVEVEPNGATEGSEASASRPRRRKLLVAAIAALLILITGLLGAAVVLGISVWRGHDEDSRREAALAACRQTVTNLMTTQPGTVQADVARLLDGTTGTFKSDFAEQRGVYSDVVKKEKVTSSGEVKAMGIESFDGQSARVLVAAQAKVSNAKAPKGEDRSYRMAVVLKLVDDRWLVSEVEFVP